MFLLCPSFCRQPEHFLRIFNVKHFSIHAGICQTEKKSMNSACSINFTIWLSQSYCVAVQIYLKISFNFAYDYTTGHNHTSICISFLFHPYTRKSSNLSSLQVFRDTIHNVFLISWMEVRFSLFVYTYKSQLDALFFFLFSVVQVYFRFCDHCKDASFLVSDYLNTFHWILFAMGNKVTK